MSRRPCGSSNSCSGCLGAAHMTVLVTVAGDTGPARSNRSGRDADMLQRQRCSPRAMYQTFRSTTRSCSITRSTPVRGSGHGSRRRSRRWSARCERSRQSSPVSFHRLRDPAPRARQRRSCSLSGNMQPGTWVIHLTQVPLDPVGHDRRVQRRPAGPGAVCAGVRAVRRARVSVP